MSGPPPTSTSPEHDSGGIAAPSSPDGGGVADTSAQASAPAAPAARLDRHLTPQQAGWGVLLLVIVIAALGFLHQRGGTPTETAAAPAPPSAAAAQAHTAELGAGTAQLGSLPSPASATRDAQPSRAEQTAAADVATGFITAYASYSYADPPDATRTRLRPYDTDRLDAALGRHSGATAERANLAARRETASAQVTEVDITSATARRITAALVTTQHVTEATRAYDLHTTYRLTLVHLDSGWRVDDFAA